MNNDAALVYMEREREERARYFSPARPGKISGNVEESRANRKFTVPLPPAPALFKVDRRRKFDRANPAGGLPARATRDAISGEIANRAEYQIASDMREREERTNKKKERKRT